MADLLFCVIDDVQFDKLPEQEVVTAEEAYGFAAYVVSREGLEAASAGLNEAKRQAGLAADDPIKCTVDSQVESIYRRRYPLDAAARIACARAHAGAIRSEAIKELVAADARVLACLNWPFSETPKRAEMFDWAFDNLLQRVGLLIRDRLAQTPRPPVLVLMDRHQDENRLHPIFTKAVWYASGYYSGPLKDLGVIDTLMHGATTHSTALQLADFVAGGFRDFVRWAMKGDREREALRNFGPLISVVDRSAQGRVEGVGLAIRPRAPFDVESKLAQLRTLGPQRA